VPPRRRYSCFRLARRSLPGSARSWWRGREVPLRYKAVLSIIHILRYIWFPSLGFGFFRRLQYDISQITFSRKVDGLGAIQKTSPSATLTVICEDSVQVAKIIGKDGFRILASWFRRLRPRTQFADHLVHSRPLARPNKATTGAFGAGDRRIRRVAADNRDGINAG
jgi:hypothetical protein